MGVSSMGLNSKMGMRLCGNRFVLMMVTMVAMIAITNTIAIIMRLSQKTVSAPMRFF